MAFRHEWEPDGVYMRIWGDTSGAEIDEAIGHIRNSPNLSRLHYVIADFLDVENHQATKYETLLTAAHDHWISESNPRLKIALVGTLPEVLTAFGVYAGSSVIKDTFAVKIFTDIEQARIWSREP